MADMKESCHTYEWVMWYEQVMSHIRKRHAAALWHISSTLCGWYEGIMFHIWMSHVIWTSHVTHMEKACSSPVTLLVDTLWLIWRSHVTHMDTACHSYELGIQHPCATSCRCSVADAKKTFYIFEGAMLHIWMSHVTRMQEAYSKTVTHRVDTLWLIWRRHVTHMDMACHSYELGIQHPCDTSCRYSVTDSKKAFYTFERVMLHIWMSLRIWGSHVISSARGIQQRGDTSGRYAVANMKESYEWAMSQIWRSHVMGWLRWVGSIKLQVSFAEYHLFYRALLQKRPIVLRSLLIDMIRRRHVTFMKKAYSSPKFIWVTCRIHMCDMTPSYQPQSIDEKRHRAAACLFHMCHKTCHIYEKGVQQPYDASRRYFVADMKEVCHTCEGVTSHVWRSHFTHRKESYDMNRSCHTYERKRRIQQNWDTSHLYSVADMKQSCHTCEWAMWHIWRSHVAHMKESCDMNTSCHTYERRIQQNCDTSRRYSVADMKESCHTYELVI